MLLLSVEEDIIDEEEFVLLYEAYRPQHLSFLHLAYEKFSLEDKDAAECKADFRFEKRDIPLLVEALGVPPIFICQNGTICDGNEALCIALKRFAYPCRYSDMIPIFGRSVPELSMISNEVVHWIYTTHGHKITQWNHGILNLASLTVYADAIHNKGAALENCFGFIDGTVRPIYRPIENKRIVYNGHKRVHALKFQSIALPNGLIGHMYGPVGENVSFNSICFLNRHLKYAFLYLVFVLQFCFSQKGRCMMLEC